MTTPTLSAPFDIDGLGIQIQFLATVESTRGAFTSLRYTLAGLRQGAQPHYHKRMIESFYVLDGCLTMLHGAEWTAVEPGTMVTVLPGEVHAFRNDTPDPATFLIIASPAGLERYLAGLVEIVRQAGEWPPKDPTPIVNFGRAHDTFYLE